MAEQIEKSPTTSAPELSLVIPTYNERENLPLLLERIDRALTGRSYEVIVVDDDSPDGTAKVAQELSRRYPLRVIVRKGEKGLASAVVAGFGQARGEILGVLDADLQHPPEKIVDLWVEVRGGSDLAIASRYDVGGGIARWGLTRRIISLVAKMPPYLLLASSRRTKDPLSGFFMLRRGVIDGVELKPVGYKILLEILVRGKAGKVGMVPYTFADRARGQSKFNIREQINYLKHLWRLLPAEAGVRRFLKFCAVGASGVVVNEGLLWLLTEVFGLFYRISAIFSIETSILSNFILNDLWTFRDRRLSSSPFLMRAIKFNLVSIGGAIINYGVLWAFTEVFGVYYLLSNLFGIATAVLWNFAVNTLWTWRARPFSEGS